uniref:CUB domain-containing protein n=1 Tax=Buteo japonicus TaxID=224669 RepID=A0A8C0C1Q8_9AVES
SNMFPARFRTCGGNIYINDFNPSGYISSPNYPSNYPHNLNCEWTIENPSHYNSSIYISFEDFHLEHHQDCHPFFPLKNVLIIHSLWAEYPVHTALLYS